MENTNITVDFFEDIVGKKEFPDVVVVSITKSREEWIKQLHKHCLANCAESCAYNDNTLIDFLMYGFKGFINMTDSELIDEIKNELEYLYDMDM